MMTTTRKKYVSVKSHHIEACLRHAFIFALYSELWKLSPLNNLRVYEAEVDDSGYDLVLGIGSITRHVQLKSSFTGSTTSSVSLCQKLQEVSGGCAIWIEYDVDDLSIVSYRFFGFSRSQEFPELSAFRFAKHTRAGSTKVKALRPLYRVVPKTAFHLLPIRQIIQMLFTGEIKC